MRIVETYIDNLKCRDLVVLFSSIQTCKGMRKMTHRKRRAWEASQYWELYNMLMSRDCALAWKRLWEPRPQTPIMDPNIWHTYTERLYHVPNQPPIPMPSTSLPTMGTLFTTSRVMKVIKYYNIGNPWTTQDCKPNTSYMLESA